MSQNELQPDIITKLVALYHGTTGPEQENALDKIKKQCKKHNIDLKTALSRDTDREHRYFKYWTPIERRLAIQVASKLGFSTYDSRGNRKIMFLVDCTVSEYLVFMEWYEHYRTDMFNETKKLEEAFFIAYLSKNNIFGPTEESDDDEPKESKGDPNFDVGLAMALMGNLKETSPTVKIGVDDRKEKIGKTTAKPGAKKQ